MIFNYSISSAQIFLGLGMVAVLLLAWAAQKSDHAFDIRDTLMDPATGKASLYACTIWLTLLMSLWICIDRANDGKDVDNLVLGVLGIFVLGRLGYQGLEKFRPNNSLPLLGSVEEKREETTKVTTTATSRKESEDGHGKPERKPKQSWR
jgi:hypothetical protein